jgi:hypothetical protein
MNRLCGPNASAGYLTAVLHESNANERAHACSVVQGGWHCASPALSDLHRIRAIQHSKRRLFPTLPRPTPTTAKKTHLDRNNLRIQLPALVGGHTGGNHSPANTACSAEGGLGGEEDVGYVLILTEERQVEENLDGFGICGKWVRYERGKEGGDVPAVKMMNSQIPRLRVLVASFAPFFNWL